MPRSEARIFTSIWRDEDFIALPPGPSGFTCSLSPSMTCPIAASCRCARARWAAKAAGLTIADIDRDLKTLEGTAYPSANPDPALAKTPFVVVDRDSGEVLIRSLIRRDGIWKQPNLLKQARDSADQMESREILGALLAELHRLPLEETTSELVKGLVGEFIEDLEKGGLTLRLTLRRTHLRTLSVDDPSEGLAAAQGIGGSYGSSGGVSTILIPITPGPTRRARDRKLGTRLPDDFDAAPEMVEWFREHCPHVDGKTEHEQFCDYWHSKPGKDGRKLDWVATWRRWMRTAEERYKPRPRAARQNPSPPPTKRIAARVRPSRQGILDPEPEKPRER